MKLFKDLLKLVTTWRGVLMTVLFIMYTAWVVFISKLDGNSLIYAFVFAPLIEEAVFRYSVLEITFRSKNGWRYVWQVAIIVSFIFGYIHFQNGINRILVQGVLGFFMSYVYIRYRSYWYCVILHAKWNIFCYYGLPTVMSWF